MPIRYFSINYGKTLPPIEDVDSNTSEISYFVPDETVIDIPYSKYRNDHKSSEYPNNNLTNSQNKILNYKEQDYSTKFEIESPSYSPLESPYTSQFLNQIESSPTIEYVPSTIFPKSDGKYYERTTVRHETEYSELRNLLWSNAEIGNSQAKDAYEVVLGSDSDSPSHDYTVDEIMERMNKQVISIYESKDPLLPVDNPSINQDDIDKQLVDSNDYLDIFAECLKTLDHILDLVDKAQPLPSEIKSKEVEFENNKPSKDDFDDFILTNRAQVLPNNQSKRCQVINTLIPPKIQRLDPIEKIALVAEKNDSSLPYLIETTKTPCIFKKIEFILLNHLEIAFQNIEIHMDKLNYSLGDLTYDGCKFLLDQHLELIKNQSTEGDHRTFEHLRWLVILNMCYYGLDLMFNCSCSSMISYIYDLRLKYNGLVEEDVNEVLFKIQKITEIEKKVNSKEVMFKCPKIRSLCHYLTSNMRAKNPKILIIVSRNASYLSAKTNEALLKETNLQSCIHDFLTDTDKSSSSIETHQCLIAPHNISIYDHIHKFTHVIVFETQVIQDDFIKLRMKQTLKELCREKDCEWIEFSTYKVEDSIRTNLIEERTAFIWSMIDNRDIIVSSIVTRNFKLMALLETKLKFSLYERDYDAFEKEFNIPNGSLLNVDILIDESTGCLILNTHELKSLSENEMFLKLSCLCNRIKYLYIVLIPFHLGRGEKVTELNDFLMIKKICMFLKRENYLNFEMKIISLETIEDFETFIQRLFISCVKQKLAEDSFKTKCDSNILIDERLMNRRDFFTVEPTKSELFLLNLGCVNSYQAQYMLSTHKLADIVKLRRSKFSQVFDQSIIDDKCANLIVNILKKPIRI